MADWFSSDEHFGHKNILQLSNRPFADLEEMHRELKRRWNERVAPRDRVMIVGDFSFMQSSSTRKVLQDLNGTKVLIQGNHDKEKNIPRDCFETIVTRAQYALPNGHKAILCHYPYLSGEQADAERNNYKVRYAERRPKDQGQWLIHGHVHGSWKVNGRMINVGVDVWDYYPVSIDQIMEIIDGKR
jgi:calcineurin-like phosphoesterase family protein